MGLSPGGGSTGIMISPATIGDLHIALSMQVPSSLEHRLLWRNTSAALRLFQTRGPTPEPPLGPTPELSPDPILLRHQVPAHVPRLNISSRLPVGLARPRLQVKPSPELTLSRSNTSEAIKSPSLNSSSLPVLRPRLKVKPSPALTLSRSNTSEAIKSPSLNSSSLPVLRPRLKVKPSPALTLSRSNTSEAIKIPSR